MTDFNDFPTSQLAVSRAPQRRTVRSIWAVASIFARLAFLGPFLACFAHGQTPEKSHSRVVLGPAVRQKDAIQSGKLLFESVCSACHGVKGQGGRGSKLADSEYIRQMRAKEIFNVIRTGVPGTEMIAFPLPKTQLGDLVAFVRSLNAVALEQDVHGDSAAGENLFFGKANCSSCHMIAGRGGLLGPDLSNIGQELSVEKISAAILQPSDDIEPRYRRVLVTTADGRKIEGLVKNESTYSIQLMDLNANFHFFLKSELQTILYYKESLMPVPHLAQQDFANLLAFLSRQGPGEFREPKAKTNHGGRID